MPRSIIQLVYVSSAVREFSEKELSDMLIQARLRNAASAITGVLIYAGGNFMQVLEGPRMEVKQTLVRIRRDPRHTGLMVLLEIEIADRYFPQWSMGFECIRDKDEIAQIPGYQDLRHLSRQDLESTAQKLLKTFLRHMTAMG
jgi:hypothetical protein